MFSSSLAWIALMVFVVLLALIHFRFIIISRKTTKKLDNTIQQLKSTNELKDQFFSIISHDLKGPFNGILGLSNYLNEEFDHLSEVEKKELISDINIASKNAYNLLHNLLNWARTQTGTLVFHPSVIETRQIIDFSLETVINYSRHKQVDIKIITEPGLTCFGDENMVSTILRNLVTNSIKFSPRNSTVIIEAKKQFDRVIFSVKDYGIGLTDDEISKLFHINSHFQKKGTEQEPGTGLGLILCHELAQRCNGTLWVTSKAGTGSTFFLSLPKD